MAIKHIKFLRRQKILQSDIEIRLETLGPSKTFAAKLNLGDYKFPAAAAVYVDAKQLLERIRFNFGTVQKLRPATPIDISRLKGERVTFDVFVVDPGSARKLGSAETVRPLKSGDAPNGPKELLPIDASRSLEGVLWKVEYSENWEGASDAPVLLLDKSASRGSAANMVGNHWVRALVFPAVLREILTKILLLDDHTYDKGGTAWRDSWLRFAAKFVGYDPPTSDREESSEDDVNIWIDIAVTKMAAKSQFLHNLLAEINQ